MSELIQFTVTYDPDKKVIDFNQYQVPFLLIQPIRWALQKEYDRQGAAVSDPHFRDERAKSIDKAIQANNEKGLSLDTTQMFIDFK